MAKVNFFIYFSAFFISFIFCSHCKAATDHLVINEVYPAPISSCDKTLDPNCTSEWIEIYNPTSTDILLSDYYFVDGSGNVKNFKTTDMISKGGYFVFYSSSGWLNNSGDKVVLISKGLSQEIDSVAYGNWPDGDLNDNAPALKNGESVSRIPDGIDTDNDKNDFQIVPITKNEKNILPPPVVYSDQVIITEILPHPADSVKNEFIEIFNKGSEFVELKDWTINDLDGGTPYVFAEKIIAPGQYIVVSNYGTGVSLNDTGDKISLFDPGKGVRSEIKYDNAILGKSYSLIDDQWQWTTSITPGAINIKDPDIVPTDIAFLQAISQIKILPLASVVKVRGRVTAVPGTISDQYFYIEDESGGIQCYSYYKYFPKLHSGDIVEVTGELSETGGEKRIKTSSIADISIIENQPAVVPMSMSAEVISDSDVGRDIIIEGTVDSPSGSDFYLKSGDKRIKVSVKNTDLVQKPRLSSGDQVQVQGIVSTYNGTLRILPFEAEAVKILSCGELGCSLPQAGNSLFFYLYAYLVSHILWTIFLSVKKKWRTSPRNLSSHSKVAIF